MATLILRNVPRRSVSEMSARHATNMRTLLDHLEKLQRHQDRMQEHVKTLATHDRKLVDELTDLRERRM